MTDPTVSVIMATYNGSALVGATIETLRAQRFTDFEVVIVDDRSTDDTLALLNAIDDPRFRIIASPENQGPVRARNRAFAEARGRYIAALDQDDLCHPDRFGQQVAYLDAHPETVALGTATAQLEDGQLRPSDLPPITTPALVEWMLRICNPLVWSSMMIRHEAALKLSPFTRPELLYAEDFDLYHRLSSHGRIARLDLPLLTYRSHSGGASQRFTNTMNDHASKVLGSCHAPLFGQDAPMRAGLLTRHVMRRVPVPDRKQLSLLGDTLIRAQEHFLATTNPSEDDVRLIRWETARLWGRIGRAGLRSGSIDLGDAVAVRPDHLGLGYARIDQLVLSRLIGGVRSARRHYA